VRINNIQIGYGNDIPGKTSLNIYFAGCLSNKKCDRELCQNKQLQDFNNGKDYNEWIENINLLMKTGFFDCYCLLGGEPLDQNIEDMKNLFKQLQQLPIYAYSGYDIDDNEDKIREYMKDLNIIDVYAGHYDENNNFNNQRWINNTLKDPNFEVKNNKEKGAK